MKVYTSFDGGNKVLCKASKGILYILFIFVIGYDYRIVFRFIYTKDCCHYHALLSVRVFFYSAYHYVNSWAESLDGLWQWQYWDFPLEQAFNSLVLRDGTCCCVCTLIGL